MALTDGLIGVWCEGADPVTDQHTNGLTLTNNNTVDAVAGLVGTAGDFEKDNTASLSRADEALLSTGDIDFTLAAWVQLETLAANRYACSKGQEYRLFTSGSRFRFNIANGAVAIVASTFGEPALATWHYVQVQHDAAGDLVRIRVNDGAWDEQATGGTAPTAGLIPFAIGGLSSGGAPGLTWDGLINQFAFWKALKSDDELNAVYNAGAGLAFSAWADYVPPEPEPEPEPVAEPPSGGWAHQFGTETDSDREARIKAERVRMGILPPDAPRAPPLEPRRARVETRDQPGLPTPYTLAAHLLPEDLAGLEALAARAAELRIDDEIALWLRLAEQRRLHAEWLRDDDDAAVLLLAIATLH